MRLHLRPDFVVPEHCCDVVVSYDVDVVSYAVAARDEDVSLFARGGLHTLQAV